MTRLLTSNRGVPGSVKKWTKLSREREGAWTLGPAWASTALNTTQAKGTTQKTTSRAISTEASTRFTISMLVRGRFALGVARPAVRDGFRRLVTAVISHLDLREADVDQAEDEHQREQDHGGGAADADLRELQGALVDVDRGDRRASPRTALGEEVDQSEGADGADRGEEQVEEDRSADERQRDEAEDLRGCGAVDARRLDELAGDVLQRGLEHDHGEGDAAPDVDDDDGRQGHDLQPVGGIGAEQPGQPVEGACGVVREHTRPGQ